MHMCSVSSVCGRKAESGKAIIKDRRHHESGQRMMPAGAGATTELRRNIGSIVGRLLPVSPRADRKLGRPISGRARAGCRHRSRHVGILPELDAEQSPASPPPPHRPPPPPTIDVPAPGRTAPGHGPAPGRRGGWWRLPGWRRRCWRHGAARPGVQSDADVLHARRQRAAHPSPSRQTTDDGQQEGASPDSIH